MRAELANYQRFADVTDQIVAVNEEICEPRPPNPAATAPPAVTGDEKGAPRPDRRGIRGRGRAAGRAGRRLAGLRRRRGAGGAGDPHRDDATGRRAAAAIAGRRHRAPWAAGGLREGHLAEFVGYRDKGVDTVLGRITVRRAYYHCAVCEHGIVPRDDELGVTGASLSPGLRTMVARAAAAEPFATAAGLLAELAGIQLTTKRIERCAETDGGAAAERLAAESPAIARREVAVLPDPADRGGNAGQALHRHRRHRSAHVPAAAAPGRQERRRARPHPRGQTRLPVHPDHHRRGGPAGARSGLHQLPGQLRARRPVRHPGARRSPPPRRRSHPPTRRARRRRALDLEARHRDRTPSHPDRGHLPRPRTPARPRRRAPPALGDHTPTG